MASGSLSAFGASLCAFRAWRHAAIGEGALAARAARAELQRWRLVEACARAAVDDAVRGCAVRPDAAAALGLVASAARAAWDGEDAAAAARCAVADWEVAARRRLADGAQVASKIEAAARAERVLLTDAAAATLRARVTGAIDRGVPLAEAVSAAMREWRAQVVRRQVGQAVWDPSGNSSARVCGVVRFMPYARHGTDSLDYEMLVAVFSYLPSRCLPTLRAVCKRWRSVASDPSWMPELVCYAWGDALLSGLSAEAPRPALLPFSLTHQLVSIACTDAATFALTVDGRVFHWGRRWSPRARDSAAPAVIDELADVAQISASPAGYYHGRSRMVGYSCAALCRDGALYTWGSNRGGQLLHRATDGRAERWVDAPRRAETAGPDERVTLVGVGRDFIVMYLVGSSGGPPVGALSVRELKRELANRGVDVTGCAEKAELVAELVAARGPDGGHQSSVATWGFMYGGEWLENRRWDGLRNLELRQIACGCFHAAAVTTRGELYTWGHPTGEDQSNGNLLGHNSAVFAEQVYPSMPPRRVDSSALGPVASVACSSYSSIAITVDGRVLSWGDCDGGALGHKRTACHAPAPLASLRGLRVTRGSLSYTNAAVATDDGRLYVWGGADWEGGIAHDSAGGASGSADEPTEVAWDRADVPPCYRLHSCALGHKHGFLIFRKRP